MQQAMEPATPGPAPASPGAMPAGNEGSATSPGGGDTGAGGGNMEAPPVNAPLQNPGMQGNMPAPGAGMMGGMMGEGGGGMMMPPATDPGPAPAAGLCPAGPFAASPLPAGGATPQSLCGGMTFTEGAVWFAEQSTLFFSDFNIGSANGRIMSFTPGGMCQEFIANAGTNGLVIAPDGNLLGARHGDQTLTIFDLMTRQPTVLVADYMGLNFNSPNDIAVRSDGNLYFTDPNYLLAGRMSEQPTRAYRRDPSGALTVIHTGQTNGINLSPDESKLYVSQLSGGNNILVFDVDDSGALSPSRTFVANVGSDGMAVDCAGNLYITQGGVRIFAPDGDQIGTINAPGAANVAFGGPERRTLFITATTQLLAVELAIPGLPY